MKKMIIVALALSMLIGIGTGSAFAANSLKMGTGGLNFDVVGGDNLVFGKYFVDNDLAVLAGLGLGIKGGDADGTDISLAGGARKYLSTADFAPFAGGLFVYSSEQDGNVTSLSLLAQFGAEYFLGKQFSVEGSVGFGYTSQETTSVEITGTGFTTTVVETTFKDTTIGTSRAGVSFNFYF
jgi:hypothetical protein